MVVSFISMSLTFITGHMTYISQSLELMVLWPQPLKGWDQKHVPSHQVVYLFLWSHLEKQKWRPPSVAAGDSSTSVCNTEHYILRRMW